MILTYVHNIFLLIIMIGIETSPDIKNFIKQYLRNYQYGGNLDDIVTSLGLTNDYIKKYTERENKLQIVSPDISNFTYLGF